jgi:neutral ceramidase
MITLLNSEPVPAETWQAGVARINVTPQEPLWLSGYADRDHPAEGTLHELWGKALVLQAGDGSRVVLVTVDLIGLDRRTSRSICRRLETKYGLSRDAVAICASHTHTGPVVGENLGPAYDIDLAGRKRIEKYTRQLEDKLSSVVGDALNSLQPAELSWGLGTADFAVNRRNNPESEATRLIAEKRLIGPVDHDVPVLALHDPEGGLFAIVSGYACHATVLNDYRYSGDWPGEAQLQLERRHPGAMAFFWAGCGGDQNPLP